MLNIINTNTFGTQTINSGHGRSKTVLHGHESDEYTPREEFKPLKKPNKHGASVMQSSLGLKIP